MSALYNAKLKISRAVGLGNNRVCTLSVVYKDANTSTFAFTKVHNCPVSPDDVIRAVRKVFVEPSFRENHIVAVNNPGFTGV